ncbi:putative ssDNA binding protein [Aureobasidium pullulans]|uniref:Putative ssDNA binding protein n=1 Tax=Aureobasidium pullulans TaxID=5580 RepID=A0A4S9XZB8_AURPU|nr:putative ssDNA binding protein [Aureobasidium pullulans]
MFAAHSAPRILNGARAFSTSPAHSLAKMQLIGRLADQPELTPTSTGREMVRYALGVKAGPKNENGERQTSWFRVASFSDGPGRDLLLSLPKGTLMYLEADARMDTFQGQDGNNQTRLNLIQRNFETLSRPQNRQNDAESDRSAAEEPSSGIGAS